MGTDSTPAPHGPPPTSQRWQSTDVAHGYDAERFSSLLGRLFNRLSKNAIRRAFRAVPGGPRCILDLPCGTGRATAVAMELSPRVLGADISLAMMQQARGRLGAATPPLVRCDVSRQPFADGGIDCVSSIRFMMHLDARSRRAALTEMARVAKRYVVVEYGYTSPWLELRRAIKKLIISIRGKRTTLTAAVPWREIMADVREAGLELATTCFTARGLSESVILLLRKPDPAE